MLLSSPICGVESSLGLVKYVRRSWREDNFLKPVLESGARMARHENALPSAQSIIRLLIDRDPLPLQIQKELVEERKDIVRTSAGRELDRELSGQLGKYQEDMRILAEEMEQAVKEKDEESRGELEIETRMIREETRRLEKETMRLASDYRREKIEFQAHLAKLGRGCDPRYPTTSPSGETLRLVSTNHVVVRPHSNRRRTSRERSGANWCTIVLSGFGG